MGLGGVSSQGARVLTPSTLPICAGMGCFGRAALQRSDGHSTGSRRALWASSLSLTEFAYAFRRAAFAHLSADPICLYPDALRRPQTMVRMWLWKTMSCHLHWREAFRMPTLPCGVSYSSQLEPFISALLIRRTGSAASLVTSPGSSLDPAPDKPPRMRWMTYRRLKDRYERLEEQAGAGVIMRFEDG